MPDYDYNASGYRIIPDTRDLEDFARLWICGVNSNLLAALPTNSTITLSWANTDDGNPTIDLFQAADADGGIGYLTNETIATEQVVPNYIARVAPNNSIRINANQFVSVLHGNHFIWCGVTNGSGQLNLTIADASGNILVQASQWIQIKDIKQMYERWTVGENPNAAPMNSATWQVDSQAFRYASPTDTNTPYILFVHGWNMQPWEKDRFAETAFKRLYWQGYQGRFGSFRWPTFNNWPATETLYSYDKSEFQAWKSGVGLKNFLTKLNSQYQGNVYLMAHSMGNVVAGEALKQAGTNILVNTYIAMQAAIPAHAYDAFAPTRTIPVPDDSSTPNRYAYYYTDSSPCYFNGIGGAGTFINFFNTNDFALNQWQTDQNIKPRTFLGYGFDGTNFDKGFVSPYLLLLFPADTHEIFSFCDEARCYALGAQADIGGKFTTARQVNLQSTWPADPEGYVNHIWHSAEFRSDCAQRWLFWDEVLFQMRLKNNL